MSGGKWKEFGGWNEQNMPGGPSPWKMSSIPDVNGAFTTAAVGAASQPDVGLQNDSPSQAPQAYTPTMMG